MRVVEIEQMDRDFPVGREFPWGKTVYDKDSSRLPGRYYDFKAHPELISTSLEDFLPWNDYAAIQEFYKLIKWINSPESQLETDDCAFDGELKPHQDELFEKWNLRCAGRVMIFHRDLIQNTKRWAVNHLQYLVLYHLNKIDSKLEAAVVTVGKAPIRFLACAGSPTGNNGFSLVLRFYSYGNTQTEVFKYLERTFRNMLQAIKRVSSELNSIP